MTPPPSKREAEDTDTNGESENKKKQKTDDEVTPADTAAETETQKESTDKDENGTTEDDTAGGELLFFGMTNWDMCGRKEPPKGSKKSAGGPNLFEPHRLKSLEGVKMRSCHSSSCAVHCAAVDSTGQVYTWGRNENGQLGNGKKDRVELPEAVDALEGEDVVAVAMGRRHTLFLTAKGEVYSCGDNKMGQLGIGNTSDVTTPTRIDYKGPPIKRIACGGEFSVIVDIKGNLYTFGCPEYGQLGHNTDGKYFVTSNKMAFHTENSPRVVTVFVEKAKTGQVTPITDVTVAEVACGVNHTIMLDTNKRVFAWGFGGYGRLGNESPKDVLVPQLLNFFAGPKRGASKVFCGSTFSLAVNEFGVLYFWGQTKSSGEANMYPKIVTDLQGWEIKKMACTYKCIVTAADDSVVAWGPSPTFGEMCFGEDVKSSTKPKECKPMEDFEVLDLACGINCTMFVVKNTTKEQRELVDECSVYEGPN